MLAQAAEQLGVDLRVLVLTRRAADVLYDSLYPAHGFSMPRATMMMLQCRHLLAQLSQMDPRFLMCFPYETYQCLPWGRVARFLGVDVRAAVRERYRPNRLNALRNDRLLRESSARVQNMAARLQTCIDHIEGVADCSSSRKQCP